MKVLFDGVSYEAAFVAPIPPLEYDTARKRWSLVATVVGGGAVRASSDEMENTGAPPDALVAMRDRILKSIAE
jgi:hypothetical protein